LLRSKHPSLTKFGLAMNPSKLMVISGATMVVSGLIHAVYWAVTGESWEGPLSIRKPILFGVSTGVTLISLGWIHSKLTPTNYDRWLGPILSASLLIEVGLITMQYWRGEASHFNHASAFDLVLDRSITFLIILASVAIFDLARRSFSDLNATTSMKFAIRSGMVFLLVSCGLGFFILFYGEYLVSLNMSPTTFGKAGVMKFPHGITIHAIQYLPMLVWAMSWLKIHEHRQVQAVKYAVSSMAVFLLFSMWQTFNGLDRFDIGWAGAIQLLIALAFAIAVILEIFNGMRNVQVPRLDQ
jgi:hypothetical protein